MRRIYVGIIAVALFGLTACSSSGSGSITAPSPATGGASTSAPTAACGGPNCSFVATPFSGGETTWKGITTANSAPSTGHHGSLEVTFAAPSMLGGGSTLSWSRFSTGSKAHCTISNNIDTTVITLPSCDDGSYVVHPTVTTVYTFTDTKNDPPSQDEVQTATTTVEVPTMVSITAKWQSGMGPGDDDALVVYEGTATGPLTHLDVNATSQTFCGLSGNRTNPANTFHATMSVVDATNITGTYEGVACTVDLGTFTLTKQ